jgi:hypothetical protein
MDALGIDRAHAVGPLAGRSDCASACAGGAG